MFSKLIKLSICFILFGIILTPGVFSQVDLLLQRNLASYQTCKSDVDCKVSNSFCDFEQGLCKCNEGFIIIRNRQGFDCVKGAESIESECTYDEQCQISLGKHSTCDEQEKCTCLENAHFVKRKNSCFTTSRLNETCISNENCIPNHPDDEVFCTNGRCTCGLKQMPNAQGRCATVRRLGEACNSDDSCLSMNAVCRITCTCRVGYVLEKDERYCLKAAEKLFDACTQNSQCEQFFQHSECVRGRCQCKTRFHQYGNNCYMPSNIGSLCKHKGECITSQDLEGRVDCVNSVCLCNPELDAMSCGDTNSASRVKYSMMQIYGLICSSVLFLLI